MRFVDHQQGNPLRHARQHLVTKALVGQPFWRDQQDVHLVAPNRRLDTLPIVLIVGIDRDRPHPHALRRGDLVAHQRQQRRDEQGRPQPCLPQQLGGDEIDETLAPAGFLHHQKTTAALDDVADSFFLSFAEASVGFTGTEPEELQRTLLVVSHARLKYLSLPAT